MNDNTIVGIHQWGRIRHDILAAQLILVQTEQNYVFFQIGYYRYKKMPNFTLISKFKELKNFIKKVLTKCFCWDFLIDTERFSCLFGGPFLSF